MSTCCASMHTNNPQMASPSIFQALFTSSNHPGASVVTKHVHIGAISPDLRHNLALSAQHWATFAVIGSATEPVWLGNTLSKPGIRIWWIEHYGMYSNQHMWRHLVPVRSFWKLLIYLPAHTKRHTYEIHSHCFACDKAMVMDARQHTMNTHK